MPPQRTFPPAKPVKTERTHEENQERAYIAASRRSDRSLEARVESARRASEIHKRRTGRSLRVTEQDVVNEEMYEEEDDDLPLQYRRLTAHLQTGSADFNRRLAAYLSNHVAMRSALDQAITNSYAQQYPNAPQFAHNQQSIFPSPLLPQGFTQNPSNPRSVAPQQSPHPFRQSPYPMPGTTAFRQTSHNRSTSMSETSGLPIYSQNYAASPLHAEASHHPRLLPGPSSAVAPVVTDGPAHQQLPQRLDTTSEPTTPRTKHAVGTVQTIVAPGRQQKQQQPQQHLQQQYHPRSLQQDQHQDHQSLHQRRAYQNQNFSPLSTTLPMESQMFLGSMLDPSDPLTAMLMSGNEGLEQPFYDFGSNSMAPIPVPKQHTFHPYDGMNATLAPSALHMSPSHLGYGNSSADSSALKLNFDRSPGEFKPMFNSSADTSSGNVTPGIDGDWDSFINDNSWAENGT